MDCVFLLQLFIVKIQIFTIMFLLQPNKKIKQYCRRSFMRFHRQIPFLKRCRLAALFHQISAKNVEK